VLGGAAAQGQDQVGAVQQPGDYVVLEGAEGGLAVVGEDLPDGAPRPLLEDQVAVGELQTELFREQRPDGGLPGSHEADQDDHGSSRLVPLPLSATSSAMACRASW
jgi:hypothetical protein